MGRDIAIKLLLLFFKNIRQAAGVNKAIYL